MAAMPMCRRTLVIAFVACLVASPAHARGVFKGTFGSETFKSKRAAANCFYFRSGGQFSVQGAKGGRRLQTGSLAGGFGADPTAPGAIFPIVLTTATASFTSGPPPTPPTWGGFGGDVVVTLTGYRNRKVSGTITGTLQPVLGGATGTIPVNATFTIKCRVL